MHALSRLFIAAVLAALAPRTGFGEPAQPDPGLKSVVHVAFVVRDIEATTRHWAEMLGVKPPRIWSSKPGNEVGLTVHGKPSNARIKLAFIQAGAVQLEFIQPLDAEASAWREFLEKTGGGVHHLGFKVEDPANASARLAQQGMPEVQHGRYDSLDGDYIYHDSAGQLGVMVELLHSDPKPEKPAQK